MAETKKKTTQQRGKKISSTQEENVLSSPETKYNVDLVSHFSCFVFLFLFLILPHIDFFFLYA